MTPIQTIGKVSDRARQLFTHGEKFLVLEVAPGGANALFLSVDDDRKLVFEKFIRNADLKKFLGSPWRRLMQKSWEGEYLFKSHRKIIVAADPSLATTMPIPLELARDRARWKDEIALEELENLIAQAMAKIFTQCRSEAAKRLGIDDIHTILVGAKADRFRIDGHAVMNPIGFTGRKLSLLLELTFTSRDVFESLKQFFNSPDEFFFIESPQAWLLATARARELPLNLVAGGGEGGDGMGDHSEMSAAGESPLFVFENAKEGYPVLYRETLKWSFDKIFFDIAAELGVNLATGRGLYRAYRAGALSETAARAFKKILQPAIAGLLDEVEKAKIHGSVYFDAAYPAPFALPFKHKGASFDELPLNDILAELDLGVLDDDASLVSFRHLAPFLEAYFAKNTSEINQKLRRRLHWLV